MRVADHYTHEREEQNSKLIESHNQIAKYIIHYSATEHNVSRI